MLVRKIEEPPPLLGPKTSFGRPTGFRYAFPRIGFSWNLLNP